MREEQSKEEALKKPRRLVPVAAAAFAVVAMGSVPVSSHVFAAHSVAQSEAPIRGKVGFLMSDFTSSARWKLDEAAFKKAVHKVLPYIQVIVTDAKAAQTTQQNQAQSDLTNGVKVLIDVPVDAGQAAQIIRSAHTNSPRVPVIAYDRLITGAREDAYVSFDNYGVGVAQGKYLRSHVAKGGTLVELAGAASDNNAHLFHAGAMSVLQPLIKSGYYKLGYSIFTPNWDAATALKEMQSALNKLNNKVNGVLAANDGMAGAAVTALKAQNLNGKVAITGQDGTTAGLQQILLGNQGMTIYKPVHLEAEAAARWTTLFLRHKRVHEPKTTTTGAGPTPTKIDPITVITKNNIKMVVHQMYKDGYVTRAELCNNMPASACAGM